MPNGMVRITHNPLTNSAVITPLYGPLEPTPSYLQQPPSLTSQHARMAPPKSPSVDTPLKTSNSTAPAQQQKPPASSLPTSSNPSQPQQMVTIRRVMQPNLSEPVVTVTVVVLKTIFAYIILASFNWSIDPFSSKEILRTMIGYCSPW